MIAEDILRRTFDKYRFADYLYGETLDAVLETMDEVLKIAAEKAKLYHCNNIHNIIRYGDSFLEVSPGWYVALDKNSILNCLKD